MRNAGVERCLEAGEENGALYVLDRGHSNQINEVLDPRVLLIAWQRVGMELLGEMLCHGVHGEANRRKTSEAQQVRALKKFRRSNQCITARQINMEFGEDHAPDSEVTRTRTLLPGAPCNSCAVSPRSNVK